MSSTLWPSLKSALLLLIGQYLLISMNVSVGLVVVVNHFAYNVLKTLYRTFKNNPIMLLEKKLRVCQYSNIGNKSIHLFYSLWGRQYFALFGLCSCG